MAILQCLPTDSLNGISFGQDVSGNWGYIKAGADTVIPFKSNIEVKVTLSYASRGETYPSSSIYTATEDCTAYVTMGVANHSSNGDATRTSYALYHEYLTIVSHS